MVCSHDTSCEPEMPNIDDQSLKRLSGDPGRWLMVARAGRDLAKMSSVEQKLAS